MKILTLLIIAIFTGMGRTVKAAPPVQDDLEEVYCVDDSEYIAETSCRPHEEASDDDVGIYEAEEENGENEAYTSSNDEGYTYYGNMILTAYEWTDNTCADGRWPELCYTAACNDPNLWYKWVYIEGVGTYFIHDTGAMSSNVIDIYLGDYDSCINFGSFSADVYIIE